MPGIERSSSPILGAGVLDVPPEVWGHLHDRSEKAELLRSSDSGTVLCLVSIRVLESVVAMGT